MTPMFHFFCKKPDKNDPETANIKSVTITQVTETLPSGYAFEIEYKDGKKQEMHSGAQYLHDKFAAFLDKNTIHDLHNELRNIQRLKLG